MAKCVKCGKKGLFLSVNKDGLCSNCAAEAKQEAKAFFAQLEAENKAKQQKFDEENKVLAIYNAANEQYKKDKDLNALIAGYEKAFANPTIDSLAIQFHGGNIKLAEFYIRNKEYDKAWGYLNSLVLRDAQYKASGKKDVFGADHFLADVRLTQAKILKKEEKYKDAVEMLMLGYVNHIDKAIPFKAEKFEKDISTMAKKLGWDDSMIQKLEKIIINAFGQVNKEDAVMTDYRKILNS